MCSVKMRFFWVHKIRLNHNAKVYIGSLIMMVTFFFFKLDIHVRRYIYLKFSSEKCEMEILGAKVKFTIN